MTLKPREIELTVDGPIAIHDMPCAVYPTHPAVYSLDAGIFEPSWHAQGKGWHLVHARTRFQRWILQAVFGKVDA